MKKMNETRKFGTAKNQINDRVYEQYCSPKGKMVSETGLAYLKRTGENYPDNEMENRGFQ